MLTKLCAYIEGREEILESLRQEGQRMHLASWTNTFSTLDKYILKLVQIHLAICNLDKSSIQIWTNTIGKDGDKSCAPIEER